MSKFLFYSDYLRFFEDLNSCRELVVIADLLNDFTKFYIKDNPSLHGNALDAIWNLYPEYDMECNVDLLFKYDIELFSEYKNPKLEFAAQYLYYLADQNYEIELKNKLTLPTDDIEEVGYDNRQKSIASEAGVKYDVTIPSFGMPDKYKRNIEDLIRAINEEIEICRDGEFPNKFANLLANNNLSDLNIKEREFNILCNTNILVYIFESLKIIFKINIYRSYFDEYCVFMMIKSNTRLSSGTFNTTNSRNGVKPPIQYKVINEICERYAPSIKRV
jgi:hypothetical protein